MEKDPTKFTTLLSALLPIALLAGCSGSSTTVHAGSTYSNASVSGTYSVLMSLEGAGSGTGSFIADGNGNITSGSVLFFVFDPAGSCNVTFSGTYSVPSNANGTAALTPSVTNVSGTNCSQHFPLPWNFNVQAGADGASLLFVTSTVPDNGGQILSGSAIKQ